MRSTWQTQTKRGSASRHTCVYLSARGSNWHSSLHHTLNSSLPCKGRWCTVYAARRPTSRLCAGAIICAATWRGRRPLRAVHIPREALHRCAARLLRHVSHLARACRQNRLQAKAFMRHVSDFGSSSATQGAPQECAHCDSCKFMSCFSAPPLRCGAPPRSLSALWCCRAPSPAKQSCSCDGCRHADLLWLHASLAYATGSTDAVAMQQWLGPTGTCLHARAVQQTADKPWARTRCAPGR